MPTANLARVANLPPEERLKGLLEEQRLQLLEIRPRTDLAVSPSSFQAKASFGQPAYGFRISFVGTNPDGSGNGLGDVMEELTPQFWPDRSYDMSASRAQLSVGATVPVPSPALADDGVVATLKNLSNGDQFTLVGSEPPSGPNVTISQDYTYEFTTPANTNEVMGRTFIGTARLPSGWLVSFTKAVFIYESQPDRELCACQMEWAPPPPESITIANATFTPSGTSTNASLDFQISTVNATLKSWTVDLQQNNATIRSFPFTTDTRGPGTAVGSNPTNVTLGWDGLDSSNRAVTGNVTWQITAQTINYLSGGPVNDGIRSAQSRLDGTIATDEVPLIISAISSEAVTMLDTKNQVIGTPQFVKSQRRADPITIPMNSKLPIEVSVTIGEVPKENLPATYIIWGREEQGAGPSVLPILGPFPVKFTRSFQQITANCSVQMPQRIKQIPRIVWYWNDPKGGLEGSRFDTTLFPLYVTLDKPQPPQQSPRVDVIDYAVRAVENEVILTEANILRNLALRIYRGSYRGVSFLYDAGGDRWHTDTPEGDKSGRNMVLTVSNFIAYPGNSGLEKKGNCEDFSNLLQVCGAALGTKTLEVRKINDTDPKKGRFVARKIWPVGFGNWVDAGAKMYYHQVGWSTASGSVFDPTYQLEKGGLPALPLGMDPVEYQSLLQDSSQKPDTWKWQSPDRPVLVR